MTGLESIYIEVLQKSLLWFCSCCFFVNLKISLLLLIVIRAFIDLLVSVIYFFSSSSFWCSYHLFCPVGI